MQEETTYKHGDIVLYNNKPAMVLAMTTNGRGVVLRMAGKMYASTVKENLKPYTGEEDAVSLGLTDSGR